jgi:histone H3/H4
MSEVETADSEEKTSKSFLPRPRIDRYLRRQLGRPRVSAGVSVYTTAGLETLFKEILRAANKEAGASRKKRIGTISLMKAVRSDPNISRLFRNYTFFRADRLKYDSLDLMTKTDRNSALEKRKDAKKKKESVDAVPAVDEE